MRSTRAILSVQYTPAGTSIGKKVGGFLRYAQYRDHHEDELRSRGVGGLLRYVAYRDLASPEGRLFNAGGRAGEKERRTLLKYVQRSVAKPAHGKAPRRAVYRLVLSPEDARGLDLRVLTRQVMGQLERDLGPGALPPWIAAEHRNTAHPHVHIVLAAQREFEPGRFRSVIVTRDRLARMKVAMAFDIERQRFSRRPRMSLEDRLLDIGSRQRSGHGRVIRQNSEVHRRVISRTVQLQLKRIAARYWWDAERQAELSRANDRFEHEH